MQGHAAVGTTAFNRAHLLSSVLLGLLYAEPATAVIYRGATHIHTHKPMDFYATDSSILNLYTKSLLRDAPRAAAASDRSATPEAYAFCTDSPQDALRALPSRLGDDLHAGMAFRHFR